TAPRGTTKRRPLPSTVLDGWNGLKDFLRFTVRNSTGKLVTSLAVTFCPDSSNTQRTSAVSAATSPYPLQCNIFDPFQLSSVWGIQRGWAVDPAQSSSLPDFPLAVAKSRVTERTPGRYIGLSRIPADFAPAPVAAKVVRATSCGGAARRGASSSHPNTPIQPAPEVPHVVNPPRAALPDLVAQ